MPEIYHRRKPEVVPPQTRVDAPPYAELQVCSNFSFLRGASHPEELVSQAAALGYRALAVTDINSLAGVVRAHTAAKQSGLAFVVGCRLELVLEDELPPQAPADGVRMGILAFPVSRKGYANLCRLLTIGKRRVEKGQCLLTLSDLLSFHDELQLVVVPPLPDMGGVVLGGANAAAVNLLTLCDKLKAACAATDSLSIALTLCYGHNTFVYRESVLQVAAKLGVPLVATNDVHYHVPERRALQDVVTCIRHRCTVLQAGYRLFPNAERCLKTPQEMHRLFREHPAALRRTIEIAERAAEFSLDQLRYEYPEEICPAGKTPLEYLTALTWEGANERYPGGVPEKVRGLIEQELTLVSELHYEPYFLTCSDIVRFARSKGILCQGRGAAANSAICYCLGITSVDPAQIDTLFARFVSRERNEPPDIDIDFEHERREEVIQYIYGRYGRERAGLTCEVITYRQRSAAREVGKALGLSLEMVDKLAKSIHRWLACRIHPDELREMGLDPGDVTVVNTLCLSNELLGFPRHLSQHVGGFVICRQALCESVPILNAAMPDRTIIEWDKDDIDELGMLKIDCLGLGMLTCIRKALAFINERRRRDGGEAIELYTIPREDPQVYDMICRADTLGVFQIESRAQMSMLPRLKPRCFYDLIIEVAIVRPGPIHGNMVHPFLKRRAGIEKVNFPDVRVKEILGKTLGVPIFQEQAMRLAIVLANFTPGEAEQLRRAMGAWRRNKDLIATFKQRIMAGMAESGYPKEFAESCCEQIKGFSEYGFPESHAASFALLVYASSWIKRYYPAEFAAALLNSQPMGFYAPAQIVRDAQAHGVTILPVDCSFSDWDCTLEASEQTGTAVRLGMRMVKGLREDQARLVREVRGAGRFASIEELWKRGHAPGKGTRLRKATLQALARADAFASLELTSRQALWSIRALVEEILPLDERSLSNDLQRAKQAPLPELSLQQSMFNDYAATGLSLKAHPLSFIRPQLDARMVCTAAFLRGISAKQRRKVPVNSLVSVAGVAIVRQRPGTAKGVVFITLEDETGITNLIIRPEVFDRYYKVIVSSACLLAHGILERVGEVVYINTQRLESLDAGVLGEQRSELPNNSYSY